MTSSVEEMNGKARKKKRSKEGDEDGQLRKQLKRDVKHQQLSWRKRKEKYKGKREEKLLEQLKEQRAFKEVIESPLPQSSSPVIVDQQQNTASPGRSYTLSIAIPGSILDNAQSSELKAYLAGQIARAAAVFCVDEIIVFDERAQLTQKDISAFHTGQWQSGTRDHKGDCNFYLARLLQYLECPQYLRKSLFPLQKTLQYAGLLNPLDCPHHLRSDDLSVPYREAVVLNKPVKEGRGSFCDAGFYKEVQVERSLQVGLRVTVKLTSSDLSKKHLRGRVVSPSTPREENGLYWGYSVRVASCLAAVFSQSPYSYDLTIGTSERGQSIDQTDIVPFKHALVVFGGLRGLESCVEADESLSATDPSLLFDRYINSLPEQGSRTIRTEEALLITLAALRPKLIRAATS